MKKLITILTLLLISQVLFAQTPQATSYQAVIRNSSGNVLSNQLVKVRFSIHDSAANGTVVYQETQTPTTNSQGLINLFAGQGTAVTGTFAGINWGSKSKFLQTEIDIAGGINYTDMGTMQLMSVPYALYANTAANGNPNGTAVGEMLYWSGTTWVKVAPGSYGQFLSLCDGVPTWGGCTPKVTTTAVSAVSYTTATSGGNVTADGGANVTSRGVCWSTIANPTIALTTKTNDGSGSASFTSNITGLAANTTYYVRAYATNTVGTSYGAQQTFTTLAYNTPTVSTNITSAVANSSAVGGGNVTTDGGTPVLSKGVCWSTNSNPTVSLFTKTVNGTGIGTFLSNITGLAANTTYHVRAYATNSVGTSYGIQDTFTTINTSIPSVTIGTQIWSSKNLDVSTYRNGDVIPQVTSSTQLASLTTGAWCWYNNDSLTYSIYGKLYNWYAVNDPRGLAPQGWHVPTNREWNIMTKYLDPSVDTTCVSCISGTTIGIQLKNTSGWGSSSSQNGTNSSRFTGLPGGASFGQGSGFTSIGSRGLWWSSTEYNTNTTLAWFRDLINSDSKVNRNGSAKSNGFSVRVVKD